MAKDFDKLVAEIMKECQEDGEEVTLEEAKEMAEMELRAKQIKRNERKIEVEKKPKKPRNVKISDEKKELFNTILKNLDRTIGIERENIEVLKENKLIRVKINDKFFKIDIVEERKKKENAV